MVPFGVIQLVIPNTWAPVDYISPSGDIYYNHNTTECNINNIKLVAPVTRICYSSYSSICASNCIGSLPMGIAFMTFGSLLFAMLVVGRIYRLRNRTPVLLSLPIVPNKPTVTIQTIDVPDQNSIEIGKSVDSDRHIIIINPSL
jgi:hypothetical protein